MKNKCLICGGDTVAIMKKSLCDACYPNAISAIYEKQCVLLNAAQATACAIIGAMADQYPAMRFTPTERKVCYNGRCEFGLNVVWLDPDPNKAEWRDTDPDKITQWLLLTVRLHTDERGVWRELRLTDKKGELVSYLGCIEGFADLDALAADNTERGAWVAKYYDWTDAKGMNRRFGELPTKGGNQS